MNENATALHESKAVVVARPPEVVYEMVADVTRMGEWSPVCKACWWDTAETNSVGAVFTGRNEFADRTWETRAEVVVADPGRAFAFVVLETGTRWGYQFSAVKGGTRVTETWDINAQALAVWRELAGSDAEAQIRDRVERTRSELFATLTAIKSAAEST